MIMDISTTSGRVRAWLDMHLVDHGRAYIEKHFRRPLADRLNRWLLQRTIPYPGLFRLSLLGAAMARPFAGLLPVWLRTMLELAPRALPAPSAVDRPQTFRAVGPRRARVAMLTGCAQQVIAPQINEATMRLLTRLGHRLDHRTAVDIRRLGPRGVDARRVERRRRIAGAARNATSPR